MISVMISLLMERRRKAFNIIYLVLEAALFLALLVFQILSMVGGYRVYNQEGPYSPYIGAFQIGLTAVTFVFVLYVFFAHKDKPRSLVDLAPLYALSILVADFFFSLSPYPLGGHIGFLCAYILFFVMRKGHWVEGLVTLVVGSIALVVFWLIGKLSLDIGLDCFLGATLLCNVIMMWVRYGKKKERHILPLCIALTLLVLSDGSIAVRAFVTSFPANHIISMFVWPTYVAADVILAFAYQYHKSKA